MIWSFEESVILYCYIQKIKIGNKKVLVNPFILGDG